MSTAFSIASSRASSRDTSPFPLHREHNYDLPTSSTPDNSNDLEASSSGTSYDKADYLDNPLVNRNIYVKEQPM